MTLRIHGMDVVSAIEVAALVGSIVAMLVIGLIVFLMVRPVRNRGEAARAEPDRVDAEEMVRLMEVMERRLELLERAVADQRRDEHELLDGGVRSPATRRTK
jgi:large-conductance mechanosensitive channel